MRYQAICAHLAMLAVGASLMLAACASAERTQHERQERLLSAAGFEMRPADTPEKLASLKAQPQNKLVAHERDGKVTFTLADAATCGCLFVGSQADYQAYQRLSVERQIAGDQRYAAEVYSEGPLLDWGVWGTPPGW